MLKEAKKWPYDFPSSADYPSAKQRGQIHGRLLVYDQCISTHLIKARSAYVGLAPPGDQGSFQDDSKVVYQSYFSYNTFVLFFISILLELSILDTGR